MAGGIDDSAAGTVTISGSVGACPGCGLAMPMVEGPTHPYMICSPACWAVYGRLLAAQYQQPERMTFHQLVVDAYAVQHPGSSNDHRAVRSVGIHLMTLCLFLEHGADPALGTELHRRMVERPVFHRLEPPAEHGAIRCVDVPLSGPTEQVRKAAYDWARSVWSSWSVHHDVVRRWVATSGLLETAPTGAGRSGK